jgi:hypothetical protein
MKTCIYENSSELLSFKYIMFSCSSQHSSVIYNVYSVTYEILHRSYGEQSNTHTMPAPAGATALKKDIPVMANPFAAPLWS